MNRSIAEFRALLRIVEDTLDQPKRVRADLRFIQISPNELAALLDAASGERPTEEERTP